MRKTFGIYLSTLVFILLSVFQLQANSIAGQEHATLLSQYCKSHPQTSTQATILPYTKDHNFNIGQILPEETEIDESNNAEGSKTVPDFQCLGLTAFILDFYLNTVGLEHDILTQSTPDRRAFTYTHCKRFIQLEVFRI